MTHRHLSQRLAKLETHTRRGYCACPGTARFTAPSRTHSPDCPHCGHPRFIITIPELPPTTAIPVPEDLLAALQRAHTRHGIDLTVLSTPELDQLQHTLAAVT